jgi:hypothetical protein
MINNTNQGRLLGVLLATMYAGVITSAIRLWFGLHIAVTLLMLIGL